MRHPHEHLARRIAAILLMEPELDANYEAVRQASYAWPAATAKAASHVQAGK